MNMRIFSESEVVNQTGAFFAQNLQAALSKNKSVLLLLSGGSSIEMYAAGFKQLQKMESGLENLSLGLVDERFGEYDHADSNGYQLKKILGTLSLTEILQPSNTNLDQTTATANERYQPLFETTDYIISWLGLGSDGHTAGWIPTLNQDLFKSTFYQQQPLIGFETNQFTDQRFQKRITATIPRIAQSDEIHIYAPGEKKESTLVRMQIEMQDENKQQLKSDFPISALYDCQQKISLFTDVAALK